MNQTIKIQGQHHKKVAKFARLLEPFNGNVTQDIKTAFKNGFNVEVNHQAKIQGFQCAKCGKSYKRVGWVEKHSCQL